VRRSVVVWLPLIALPLLVSHARVHAGAEARSSHGSPQKRSSPAKARVQYDDYQVPAGEVSRCPRVDRWARDPHARHPAAGPHTPRPL